MLFNTLFTYNTAGINENPINPRIFKSKFKKMYFSVNILADNLHYYSSIYKGTCGASPYLF